MPKLQTPSINPLDHPICLRMPHRNLPSAWMEHVPFAMYLVDIIRPRIFVELGTFYGVSYCAFCQAVSELEIDSSCYAVDTWAGDEHTGSYESEVLSSLRQHHDPLYSKFSTLIQSTFDDALDKFQDGTIDLLHIDGYHTYEAVKHDFETWKPKLSDRGVVILHDTNERSGDFGVWRLMEELNKTYPCFEFTHGHGLGVVAVGENVSPELLSLLNMPDNEQDLVRIFFYELGQRMALSTALAERHQTEHNLRNDLQAKTTELEGMRRLIIFRILSKIRRLTKTEFPINSNGRRAINKSILGFRGMLRISRQMLKGLNDGIAIAKRYGILTLIRRIRLAISRNYSLYVYRKRVKPTNKVSIEKMLNRFNYQPLISIVMPTYNTPVKYLKAAVTSVQKQIYKNWELCICDDASTSASTQAWLNSIKDDKIKVVFAKKNEGISSASNKAIENTSGEFIAFLDHDDELTPDALFEMVRLLNSQPDLDIIYSDQDKIDHRGRRSEPFFKPDWSPEYVRAVMYVGHLLLMRKNLFNRLGGLDSMFDGVQDYELILRASEHTKKIAHLAKVLYHWRKIPGSIALGQNEKGGKIEKLQSKAVSAHLERTGFRAEVTKHPLYEHRVLIKPQKRTGYPKVSIIILSKDAFVHITRCLQSIFEKTTYPNYEVIVVDNGTTDPLVLRFLKEQPVKTIPFHQSFNYSKANNIGVKAADGDVIVLLNNDTEVVTPDWLEQMLFYLDDPNVAIVGPMLIYPNQTVQHAGIVLGLRGTADHIMRGFLSDSDGYAGSLSCPRNVSAITGACLMMHRDDFINTGGMVEYFGTHYQDVDLCLRFLSTGKRIVHVPYSVLIHYEGATRGNDYDHLDRALLLDTWGDLISKGDPYYNPNFSLNSADYVIA